MIHVTEIGEHAEFIPTWGVRIALREGAVSVTQAGSWSSRYIQTPEGISPGCFGASSEYCRQQEEVGPVFCYSS